MIGCSDTMFNTQETKEFVTECIAEFSTPVGNYSSRAFISREHEVQFLSYCGSPFVWNGDHFGPFAEVILDT